MDGRRCRGPGVRGSPLRQTLRQNFQAGQAVAGHRLLRQIGQGASSAVFLALNINSNEAVALKLVPLAPAEGAAASRQAFMVTAEAARLLVHPDIIAVYAAGVEGDLGWLAMEPVPGCDLSRYTRPSRRLPEAVILQIAARLARALAFAHRQGVVHRDLKPANILVNWAADGLKLADFGLARLTGASNTGTGIVMGTPAYMAPEQLAGAVPDPRTDFYALGVMLFELLAGRLPHEGATMGELLRQVAHEPAPALRGLIPELPPDVAELVARLLSKAPGARATDGDTLAAELQGLSRALPGNGAKSR